MRMIRRKELLPLFGNEKGQAIVTLMALITVVFVGFLIFLADMGRLVHDKMLAQVVADSAALTGATIQAVGLNEVADLAAEIDQIHNDFSDDLADADYNYVFGNGMKNYRYYKVMADYLVELQNKAIEEFPKTARAAVGATVELNNELYGYDTSGPGIIGRKSNPWELEFVMGDDVPTENLTRLENDGGMFYSWIDWICIPTPFNPCGETHSTFNGSRGAIGSGGPVNIPGFGGGYIAYPRRMSDDVRTYTRVRLTREPIQPFLNLALYGLDMGILPKMVVYSQAQPHKGEVSGSGEPEYEARLAPLWKVYPSGSRTSDPQFIDLQDEFKH